MISCLVGTTLSQAAVRVTSLNRFLPPERGAAVLVDIKTKTLRAINGSPGGGGFAIHALTPPGSTVKPFTLAALLTSGKLKADLAIPCPGTLRIGNRQFDCTHPRMVTPFQIDTALAYSCNNFVAKIAARLTPGALRRELEGFGLGAVTGLADDEVPGRVESLPDVLMQQMQAIGENGITLTPLGLAAGYRRLALALEDARLGPILAGLEGAVEFGTAQRAAVSGVGVAGKTGSTRNARGEFIGWFGGFMPSRNPEVAVTVMIKGRSGGADAAPIAGEILKAYRAGTL